MPGAPSSFLLLVEGEFCGDFVDCCLLWFDVADQRLFLAVEVLCAEGF